MTGIDWEAAANHWIAEPFGEDYAHACELRGLPVERLRAMPFVMNIIKVTPTRFDYVDGTLKERGFSPRQHVEFWRHA